MMISRPCLRDRRRWAGLASQKRLAGSSPACCPTRTAGSTLRTLKSQAATLFKMIKLITTFIQAANAFHVESALTLFADDAVIDDVSVGDPFIGKDGIRSYLEQFFVAYKTTSTVLSSERLDNFTTVVRL